MPFPPTTVREALEHALDCVEQFTDVVLGTEAGRESGVVVQTIRAGICRRIAQALPPVDAQEKSEMGTFLRALTFGGTVEWAPGTTAGGTAYGTSTPCRAVKLKARAANTGKVYFVIGTGTVTKLDGTSDTTSGWELAAGDETDLLVGLDNLTDLKGIGDNASDSVVVMYFI